MQERIISSVLEGRDTLAILPTGGGKSICFQVPAMMREGLAIVVSPLIALMKDQVQHLNERGIKALAIYSGMSYREIDITLDNAAYGDYKFLYVSPERLRTELFKARLAKMCVNFIVVDEAHCISQWGYDFRPDYLQIARIREIVGYEVPVIALTATATPKVAQDIQEKLSFGAPNVIMGSFARPNLKYICRKAEDKLGQILKVCEGVQGSGIVYVGRRKNAEDLANFLKGQQISAEAYHAGMSQEMRGAIQARWMMGESRVIVATNAFGMGIDKSDVRFVCHYDVPESIEAYFQEAGRAGRDGKQAYGVLVWNDNDVARLRQIAKVSLPPLEYIREIYGKVFNFLKIPYEEGAGSSRKFSVEEFAQHFQLHSATAYYAIKYIEQSGYWNLTEELEIPPKISFLVKRDELYRVQLADKDMDNFVKLLMRMYTGLFSGYVPINEEKIARVGRYAVDVVILRLKALASQNVIAYVPTIKSSLINFVNERLTDDNLRLPESEYRERVERQSCRIEAMIELLHTDEEHRVARMMEYFGAKE